MKVLEFETSKGEFLVVDIENIKDWRTDWFKSVGDQMTNTKTNYKFLYDFYYKLSEITEEQASEIVGLQISNIAKYNKLSLHELLESKGYNLFENPNDNQCGTIEWQEAEQKTFYNPYIFKIK